VNNSKRRREAKLAKKQNRKIDATYERTIMTSVVKSRRAALEMVDLAAVLDAKPVPTEGRLVDDVTIRNTLALYGAGTTLRPVRKIRT
jgi:hypothetical protein